jgi:spermidine synthase
MEQYDFYSDGFPVITKPHPNTESVESFVHFPMLFCEGPSNVLVISGGAGGVIHEILKHGPDRVDYAELDPLLLEAVSRFPTPPDSGRDAQPKGERHLDRREAFSQ